MLKVTIILFILMIATKVVCRVLVNSLSRAEKISIAMSRALDRNYMPIRISVASIVLTLLFVATVVCGIITVIQW